MTFEIVILPLVQQVLVALIQAVVLAAVAVFVRELPGLIRAARTFVHLRTQEIKERIPAAQFEVLRTIAQITVDSIEQRRKRGDFDGLENEMDFLRDIAIERIQNELARLGLHFDLDTIIDQIEAAVHSGFGAPLLVEGPDLSGDPDADR